MSINSVFDCNQCGACCQSIRLSEETTFLDRGDGVCKYFDDLNSKCSIYEHRPDICNVRVMYEQRYQQQVSWYDFTHINKLACENLLRNVEVKKSSTATNLSRY